MIIIFIGQLYNSDAARYKDVGKTRRARQFINSAGFFFR